MLRPVTPPSPVAPSSARLDFAKILAAARVDELLSSDDRAAVECLAPRVLCDAPIAAGARHRDAGSRPDQLVDHAGGMSLPDVGLAKDLRALPGIKADVDTPLGLWGHLHECSLLGEARPL